MLSTYLFILRRHTVRVVALTLLLASIVLALLTLRPPTYQSVAVVSVGVDSVAADVLGQNRYQEPERRVATELETLRSRPVADAATALLAEQGRPALVAEVGRSVRAQARGKSNYLEVVGTARSSARAQELTAAVVTSYLEYRRGVGRDALTQLDTELRERLTVAERELAGPPADELAGPPAEESRARAIAQERVDRAQELLEAVRLRLSVETTDVQLVAAPSTPEIPVGRLSLPVAVLVSFVAGGFLAMALLLALELFRDRVRTADEAAHVTGVPVLAHVGGRRGRGRARRADAQDDAGVVRSLRLGLITASGGIFPDRVMLVAADGDAASALEVATKLAAGCSSVGMRVLLLADLDDVALGTASGGLTMAGWAGRGSDLAGVFWRRITGTPDGGGGWLDVADPDRELSRHCADYDAVILAAPEPAAVDPLALAPSFGRVVVVATMGRTAARPLCRMVSRLEDVGSEPLGVVVVEGETGRRRKHLTATSTEDVAGTDTQTDRRTASASAL